MSMLTSQLYQIYMVEKTFWTGSIRLYQGRKIIQLYQIGRTTPNAKTESALSRCSHGLFMADSNDRWVLG